MGVDIDFASLSFEDLMALAKRANEAKKDLLNADAARLAAQVQEFCATVVAERAAETSEKSGWHGLKVYGLPVKVNGVEYSVSVTLTDVATTDANKLALKATADAAAPEGDTEGDTEGDESSDTGDAPADEETPAAPPVDLVKKPRARAGK